MITYPLILAQFQKLICKTLIFGTLMFNLLRHVNELYQVLEREKKQISDACFTQRQNATLSHLLTIHLQPNI